MLDWWYLGRECHRFGYHEQRGDCRSQALAFLGLVLLEELCLLLADDDLEVLDQHVGLGEHGPAGPQLELNEAVVGPGVLLHHQDGLILCFELVF